MSAALAGAAAGVPTSVAYALAGRPLDGLLVGALAFTVAVGLVALLRH